MLKHKYKHHSGLSVSANDIHICRFDHALRLHHRTNTKPTKYRTWQKQVWMKKALRETQTLRAGCSKGSQKFFDPLQTLFPRARDGQNLISWRRSLPLPTNPVWWRSTQAISSYRGNRPTNTRRLPATDRTDINTLRW